MMDDLDENVDDARGVQFPGSGSRGEWLSLGPLTRGAMGLRAEVNVGILELFTIAYSRHDEDRPAAPPAGSGTTCSGQQHRKRGWAHVLLKQLRLIIPE